MKPSTHVLCTYFLVAIANIKNELTLWFRSIDAVNNSEYSFDWPANPVKE